MSGAVTPAQRRNQVTWGREQARADPAQWDGDRVGQRTRMFNLLLFGVNTYVPPGRSEYHCVRFVYGEAAILAQEISYVIRLHGEPDFMVIFDHKTDMDFVAFHITMPAEMHDLVSSSL